MKRLGLVAAILYALLLAPAFAAEDLSGKWTGTFEGIDPGSGQQMHENIFLTLVHKGTELTGTAGPAAERQWPILKGKVDGNTVTFDVVGGGDNAPTLSFALVFADGHLKGDVKAEHDGMKLNAKVDATRVK